MRNKVLAFGVVFLLISAALAADKGILMGKIYDVEGRPVKGANVFVYNSPDVRRPADFISGHTDDSGVYSVVLPPGKYWVVARLKRSGGYGPLMPGDKHSGDPQDIDLTKGGTVETDFKIADIKEAALMRARKRENCIKITGRITDEKGAPLKAAYAFAGKDRRISGIPAYLSAWADGEGRFTLYVPRGKYYIGAATAFPPGKNYFISGETAVEHDMSGMKIVAGKPGSGR